MNNLILLFHTVLGRVKLDINVRFAGDNTIRPTGIGGVKCDIKAWVIGMFAKCNIDVTFDSLCFSNPNLNAVLPLGQNTDIGKTSAELQLYRRKRFSCHQIDDN